MKPVFTTFIRELEICIHVSDQLRRQSDKKVTDLFSELSEETKKGIHSEIKHFSYDIDRRGKDASAEELIQGIENYVLSALACTLLPEAPFLRCLASQLFLIKVLELLKIDERKALDLFSKLPEMEKNGVYDELDFFKNVDKLYSGYSEDAFYNRNGQTTTLERKGQAIENHLVRRLIPIFMENEAAGMTLFSKLPKEIQDRVYEELFHIFHFEKRHCYWRCGEYAFLGSNGEHSTLQQKVQAMDAYRNRSLPANERALAQRAIHIAALEAKCPFPGKEGYYDEPVLKKGQYAIRRSSRYTEDNPTYALIKGDSKNDHCLVKFDSETGHMLCREKAYTSLSNLLKDLIEGQPSLPVPVPIPPTTEPALGPHEIGYERAEAEELFAEGLRTKHSQSFIKGLTCFRDSKLNIDGKSFEAITGKTQQFSRQPVVSCGSSATREIILLDPLHSPLLEAHYKQFRRELNPKMSTQEILQALKDYVRKEIFTNSKETELNRIINDARTTARTATHEDMPQVPIPLIPIDHFIEKKCGVCRHHALVAAYMIDKLLAEQNPLIEGTLQHMRGNVIMGAHVWVTFIPKRKPGRDPEKYHLDTLWNLLVNFAKKDSVELLEKAGYGKTMIDDQIARTKNAAKRNGQE